MRKKEAMCICRRNAGEIIIAASKLSTQKKIQS
jgi:hypothetical protein